MTKRRPECFSPYEPEGTAPKPVPDSPTHCRGCGAVLEPLRRWGGECKTCVAERHHPSTQTNAFGWSEIERFTDRAHRTRRVRARCRCGTVRVMLAKDFDQRRSYGCKRCRLKEMRLHGVESDYAK